MAEIAVATAMLSPMLALAQTEKETLVVREITATEGIGNGNASEFKQVLGALKGELKTRLLKKFNVLSRDLKAINEEAAVSGDAELKKAKYILVTTVTGFTDGSADNPGEAGVAHTRTIKLFGTVELLKLNGETFANTPFSVNLHKGKMEIAGVARDEKFGDEMVEQVPKEAATQIATSVLFSIAPPKVTDVTGKQVTIDWGEGFIAKGDKLEVFLLKIKENADPIEIKVGDVEISRVTPTNSSGIIVGDNPGIIEGCVLRRPQ